MATTALRALQDKGDEGQPGQLEALAAPMASEEEPKADDGACSAQALSQERRELGCAPSDHDAPHAEVVAVELSSP